MNVEMEHYNLEKEGHTIELILDSLGQIRVINETVDWFFSGKIYVEIGYILLYTKLGDAKKERKFKLIPQG